MATFNDFYNYAHGCVFDTNGNKSARNTVNWNYPYDGQCVSLIKAYLKYLGYGAKAYGNAIDYWKSRNSNGILQICDVVTTPQNGDIVISAGVMPEYGHIWIWKDGLAFSQNVSGPKALLYSLGLQGQIYGYLRPKCLATTKTTAAKKTAASTLPSGFKSENATFTCSVSAINIRQKPNTTAKILGTVKKGEKVKYDGYKVAGAYVWLTYVKNNERRYLVCGETHGLGYNVKPYGTFK